MSVTRELEKYPHSVQDPATCCATHLEEMPTNKSMISFQIENPLMTEERN